jgi:signal transduction histidine kinase
MDAFLADLRLTIFDDAKVGQNIPLIVARKGQLLNIDWKYSELEQSEIFHRLNNLWWLAYVFWTAGTATLLFIRPKNIQWKLLISFNYLTAIWLAAGGGPSHWHVLGSAIVLRSTLWLCLPVYLHLHWIFPRPLKHLPTMVWKTLYLLGAALALSEWFQVLPVSTYIGGFLLALVGSVSLVIAHVILQKDCRYDFGILLMIIVLIVIPPLVVTLLFLTGQPPSVFVQGGSLLAFPALPGAYFYIAFRSQFNSQKRGIKRVTTFFVSAVLMGIAMIAILVFADVRISLEGSTLAVGMVITTLMAIIAMLGFFPFLSLPALAGSTYSFGGNEGELEIRANRLLSLFLFTITAGTILTLGILIMNNLMDFSGKTPLIGILSAVLAGTITAVGYLPFQRFVDQHVLGIQLPPTHLVESYSARITTSLDKTKLIGLINNEVLPSLFIRQSTLVLCIDEHTISPIYATRVEKHQIPKDIDISALLSQAGKYRPILTSSDSRQDYPWIRLILPIEVSGDLIGLWLLGHHDPDDYYTPEEISVLQTIANLTAIALVNIEQAERIRSLYQANIERHEQERISLSKDLHDDVLTRLAVLSMKVDQKNAPDFDENYKMLIASLRQMISGLRPAMLDYGLVPALDELVEELTAKSGNDINVQIEITSSGNRYDPMAEAHLYRIVQQACENALRHAQAEAIRIHGCCEPEGVHLIIEDDGIGFSNPDIDFNQLLANNHYGIAGMYERAEIIGAELAFDSAPDRGTRVRINWNSDVLGQKV